MLQTATARFRVTCFPNDTCFRALLAAGRIIAPPMVDRIRFDDDRRNMFHTIVLRRMCLPSSYSIAIVKRLEADWLVTRCRYRLEYTRVLLQYLSYTSTMIQYHDVDPTKDSVSRETFKPINNVSAIEQILLLEDSPFEYPHFPADPTQNYYTAQNDTHLHLSMQTLASLSTRTLPRRQYYPYQMDFVTMRPGSQSVEADNRLVSVLVVRRHRRSRRRGVG